MNTKEAEEHLRIIRSLMERATIYRAISAPTALVGGLLSLVCSALIYAKADDTTDGLYYFVYGWLAVFILTSLANAGFIYWDASRRGERFLSENMKKAFAALAPPMLAGAVVSLVLVYTIPVFLPVAWMMFYGLGLLATIHFAPRSIPMLGAVFLVSAFAMCGLFFLERTIGRSIAEMNAAQVLSIAMAVTFGGYHIIYALCTWPKKEAQVVPLAEAHD